MECERDKRSESEKSKAKKKGKIEEKEQIKKLTPQELRMTRRQEGGLITFWRWLIRRVNRV